MYSSKQEKKSNLLSAGSSFFSNISLNFSTEKGISLPFKKKK
jgi:hypothetical protein